jgi:hypothetical protein
MECNLASTKGKHFWRSVQDFLMLRRQEHWGEFKKSRSSSEMDRAGIG